MSFHCFASTTWSIYWKKRVGFPERTSLVSSSCTLSKMLWTICTSLSVISSAGKIGSKSPQFPAVSVPVETCELKLLDQQVKKNYVAIWHQASGFSKFSFFSSADISAWESLGEYDPYTGNQPHGVWKPPIGRWFYHSNRHFFQGMFHRQDHLLHTKGYSTRFPFWADNEVYNACLSFIYNDDILGIPWGYYDNIMGINENVIVHTNWHKYHVSQFYTLHCPSQTTETGPMLTCCQHPAWLCWVLNVWQVTASLEFESFSWTRLLQKNSDNLETSKYNYLCSGISFNPIPMG